MTKQELLDAIEAKKAEINAKQKEIDTFEPLDEDGVEDAYLEFLDECYGEIKIGCCTFSPSRVLKELDPIAFNCGLSEWVDGEFSSNPENFSDFVDLKKDLDELQDELSDLESELEALEESEE